MTLAFLVVPGTAVFLHVYGAQQLPFVYLIVAAVGALVSFGLTRLQSRYGLYRSAISTMVLVALTALTCWALLVGFDASGAAYGILVLFALHVQLGFVFIGAQAGRVFDIQEIKRIFPRIVAGFVFGFMVGGFIAAEFVAVFGHAHDLLAAAAATTVVMIGLMLGASRFVDDAFHLPSHPESTDATQHHSLRRILAIPLVGAVFVYQVLSAMGTQMVEYLVYDRAAARFSGTEELATFMGEYTGILNLTDLLVLVLLGGFLMSRFGLRFGLGANPVMVTGLIAAAMIVAMVSGPDAMLFFVLVAIARIADITMADAATRTSVNATFRALPVQQRLAAQVGVEGAGVPIALGLTALLILAINAVPGSSVVHVVIATLILCVLWSAMAWVVYRRYQAAVVKEARRRSLDGEVVDLSEPATRDALHALGLSDDPRDVSTAVRFIDGMEREQADGLLRTAAASPSIDVRIAVLDRLDRDPDLARPIAEDCLASGSRDHVLTGIRALGRIEGISCRPLLDAFFDSDDPTVRAAAIGAVFRQGEETDELVGKLSEAAGSSNPDERRCAAVAIAEAGRAPTIALVATLLGDPDRHVREAAAAAVASLNDAQRIELLSRLVGVPERAGFLRASRRAASPEFSARVATDLANDVIPAMELVRVLNASGWSAEGQYKGLFDRLVREKVDRIDRARGWIERSYPSAGSLSPAASRLRRALGSEAAEAGRELIEVLALGHDKDLVGRVGGILQGKLEGEPGMARESLDLVLTAEHRQLVLRALAAAFDEGLGISGRRRPPEQADLIETLSQLARDCGWAIHADWLQACALDALRALDTDPAWTRGIAPLGPVSAELVGVD
ncbi:MAG: hypothetical protein GY798_32965 [Hyphomicrobiales bacterium]|nr:hypothetical protein [Hyphomicrobiales bacterium]